MLDDLTPVHEAAAVCAAHFHEGSDYPCVGRDGDSDWSIWMPEHEGLFAVLGNPSPLMLTQPGGDRLEREDVGTAVAAAVTAVQDRWIQPKEHSERTGSLTRHEEVIRASPFGGAMLLSVPTRQEWDIPSLMGFLRSTSLRPDQVLGSRFQEFANEVEQAVLSIEPTGRWVYENSVEVILARR